MWMQNFYYFIISTVWYCCFYMIISMRVYLNASYTAYYTKKKKTKKLQTWPKLRHFLCDSAGLNILDSMGQNRRQVQKKCTV